MDIKLTDTVLLKFHFTNPKLIPSDVLIIEKDIKNITSNSTTNQEPDVEELENISTRLLVRELFRNCSFKLNDVHCHKRKKEKSTGYILVLSFSQEPRYALFRKKTIKELSQFIDKDGWGICRFFVNDNNWSINFYLRKPNAAKEKGFGELSLFTTDEDIENGDIEVF